MIARVSSGWTSRRSPTTLNAWRPWTALIIVVAALVVLSACTGSGTTPANSSGTVGGPASSAGGGTGGQIVIAAPDEPTGYAIDAGNPGGTVGNTVVINTQATLVRNPYVKDPISGVLKQSWYRFQGVLAQSWTVSSDGLTYTFHLRQGLKSQAGNPLTADDVIWSMERHWNTPTAGLKFDLTPYVDDLSTQLKKIDDHTVSLTLKRAGDWFTVMSILANDDAQVYDAALLKSHVTSADPYAVNWSNSHSGWGFGAYTVQSQTQGESTVLVANPNYVFGPPKISKVTFKLVPDSGTRAEALKSGDADIATFLLPSELAELGSAGLQTFKVESNEILHMPLITTQAPFSNMTVRQAMAYAVPYQQILANVYSGYGVRAGSLLMTDAPNYDGSGLTPLSYDPVKARALLQQAGVSIPVKFNLTVDSTSPDAVATAVMVQSYAKAAGFDVSIDQLSAAAFQQGRLGGHYQAFIERNNANVMSPPYELRLWTGKDSPFNLADWGTDEYSAAMNAALAVPDPFSAAGMQAWNKAELILQAQMPIIDIAYLDPATAFRKGLNGYALRSDRWLDLSILSNS